MDYNKQDIEEAAKTVKEAEKALKEATSPFLNILTPEMKENMSKEHYRLLAELSETVTDGVNDEKKIERLKNILAKSKNII